jgi:NADPH:quinone reductase-like Zn-dependent oxidoreductase
MTAIPDTMRALVLEGPGDPRDLAAARIQTPAAGDGLVLVRTAAAAVNRSDVLNVRGLPVTTFPRVPGRDFAGTVVSGPADLLGRRVWGTGSGDLGFTSHGTHAEFVAVPVSAIVDAPAGWTLAEAGASGLAYVAAEAGLAQADIQHGETVLVTGAAGGVGSAACAIARWRGARVIGAVRDTAERDALLRRFPDVDAVITGEEFPDALRTATSGRGVDVALDTVGNPVFVDVLAALRLGARMAVIIGRPGETLPFDLAAFYQRDLALFGINTVRRDSTWCAGLLHGLTTGFDDGSLPPVAVARTIDLDEAAAGYASTWAGDAGGRVVFGFNTEE